MIAKLTGQIDVLMENALVLDVQGVGYLVHTSTRTLNSLSSKGASISLFIEYLVRQEHPSLFGFLTFEEQEWFRLLLTVQGVGTKVALGILSTFTPSELANLFACQDKTLLTRVEGIGPRLATRLISELKDKVERSLSSVTFASLNVVSESSTLAEAISALCHLGYKRQEAASAVAQASQKLGQEASLQALIKISLGILSPLQ